MNTDRRYDIDWLRVIAIGLLIIYHVAIVFQPWAIFIGFIQSEQAMENLWVFMSMLNVWRIPLLFFVSGMGVCFALRKRNYKQLLLERTKRILVPFIFGTLVISPVHVYLLQVHYSFPLKYTLHPGHLWFLGNIFAYVLILLPLFVFIRRKRSWRHKIEKLFSTPIGLLVVALFFILETVLVKPATFEMYASNWHGFFLGLLAFLCGFLFIISGKQFWQMLQQWKWPLLLVAVVLYAVRIGLLNSKSPNYLMSLESNFWIFSVLAFGARFLNHKSKVLAYLSKAAYPVYILHMAFLYLGCVLILPLSLPVFLKFGFICLITYAGSMGFYEFLLKRVKYIRILFGGK